MSNAAFARGGGLLVAGQVTRLAVQLAGTIVLSRLLSPGDFGLVAMVFVFAALGALLRDFGVSTVMIQSPTLSRQQASNLFWLSGILGLAAGALLLGGAPLLVAMYSEPRLAHIVPFFALTLLLDGIQAPLQVQLARAMRFKAIATADVLAQLIALVVAVMAAFGGLGYWALVAQAVIAPAVSLLAKAAAARWVPLWPRRGHGFSSHLRTSVEFGLAQLLSFLANNADTMAIGVRWGATNLGYYSRAFQLYSLPRSGILDPLTQVVVPALNAAKREGRSAGETLVAIQFGLATLLTWIYLVTAVSADWLIPVVLGPQWHDSVVVFQLLCIGGAFVSMSSVSYWMFVVSEKSRQLLYLHLVTKPLAIALILSALPFGIEAVALAYSAGLALAWPINLIWLARVAAQDSWSFFRAGLRIVGASAFAFISARWMLSVVEVSTPWPPILIGSIVASVAFILGVLAVPGGARMLWRAVRVFKSRQSSAG